MENPSFIALSQQIALRRQMDVVANNVANMNTTAYKAERIMFQEMLSPKATTPGLTGDSGKIAFVAEVGSLRELREGAFNLTNNPFDMALHGPGYFQVETPAGTRYTRAGQFQPDSQGRLVNPEGLPLLDTSGRPISLRPGETRIEIQPNGSIRSESGEVGRIGVVRFENEQAMKPIGGGLYETDAEALPDDGKTAVKQGMIESSNVQGVLEMTNMIEVMRRYQTTQKILESEHERERKAIDKLSKVA
jgi:flagellar basal-body rod protein FlgF